MAVMSLRWLVAAAASLPAVCAGMGREQLSPGGPVQTPAPQLKDAAVHMQFSPVVTARPAARGLLQKRAPNTCGYLNGDPKLDYVCSHSEAECLYNTQASAMGCCLTTSCGVYTACLPFASSAATKTFDKERTRYCSNSDLPSCAVFSIADPSNSLSGYTIQTCDSVSTTYTMYLTPTTASSSSRRTSSSKSSKSSESASESSSEASESSSPTGQDAGGSQSPAETSADAGAAAPASSSTPVGPIVGGVIGGLAGLGLLGLGIFFLVRRNNHNPASPSASTAAPVLTGGPAFPPPGSGQGQQSPYPPTYANQTPPPDMASMGAMGAAGGVYDPYDPRYSTMSKPPGASSVHPMQGQQQMGSPQMSMSGVSPSGSPSPVYHQQQMHPMGLGVGMGGGTPPPQGQYGMGTPPPPMGMSSPTPPPPQGHQNGGYMPYPGPPQQQMQQGHGAVELPTQRGDGQVHELS